MTKSFVELAVNVVQWRTLSQLWLYTLSTLAMLWLLLLTAGAAQSQATNYSLPSCGNDSDLTFTLNSVTVTDGCITNDATDTYTVQFDYTINDNGGSNRYDFRLGLATPTEVLISDCVNTGVDDDNDGDCGDIIANVTNGTTSFTFTCDAPVGTVSALLGYYPNGNTNVFGNTQINDDSKQKCRSGIGSVNIPFPVPEITVVKTATAVDVAGDGLINQSGELITYQYEVTNTTTDGIVPLSGVTVEDDNASPGNTGDDFSPTFIGGDTNNDGLLDQGEVWIYEETVTVSQAQVNAGGVILNTVVAQGVTTGGSTLTATDTESVPVQSTPSIALVKDVSQGTLSAPGLLTYTITIENDGNVSLDNVVLSDVLEDGAGGGLTLSSGPSFDNSTGGDADETGTLDVGEVWTFTATYDVSQAAFDSGSVTNTATVTADDPTNTQVTATDDAVTETLPRYSAELVKTGDVSELTEPGTITYEITVTNNGTGTITGPVLDDPLTDDETLVSGDTNDDGNLDVGEAWVYSASYQVDQAAIDSGADIENIAIFTSNETPEPIEDNFVTVVVINPAFTIEKLADRDSVGPEAEAINYTITVENTGNVTLTGVSLLDEASQSNLDQTQSFPVPLIADPVLVSGDANDDGNLNVGEVWVYEAAIEVTDAMLTITDTFSPGEITNVATFNAQELDPASDNAVTQVEPQEIAPDESIDLAITKTTPKDNVLQGDIVPWIIEVTNNGVAEAQPVDVQDRLPAGFIFEDGSATINGTPVNVTVNNSVVTFPSFTVQPGTTVVLQLSTFVSGSVQPGIHTNYADLIDADGNILTASASVVLTAEPVFDCGTVIGKVFDDVNQNGYQDGPREPSIPRGLVANDNVYLGGKGGKLAPLENVDPKGEPGIPGVRIYTVKGEVYTTDEFGRFHVACADLPRDIGSNFTMKIDTRSLPAGYRLTTENPRVVRLTAGKTTKLNFGATISRLVRIDVANNAFAPGTNEPKPEFKAALARAVQQFHNKPSTVRISYILRGEDNRTALKRMRRVEVALRQIWRKEGKYKLMVEKTLQKPKG